MTVFIKAEDLKLEKLVYRYAYDSVDSWDFDDLVEFAERKVIDEGLKKIEEDPAGLIEEMKDFWNVDSLDEINPDDFQVT